MKKIYLMISCALGISTLINAQQVLTANGINPVSGDKFVLKNCQDMPPGAAGANQTWNFSAMNASTTTSYTYAPASTAPAAADFPNADLVAHQGSGVYSFWKVTGSALTNMGHALPSFTQSYSNGEDLVHFPFAFTNTFVDTWSTTYTLSSFVFVRSGTTTVNYDAYGTITTPSVTLNNAVRVHFQQSYNDVYSMGTINYTNDQYFWFVNGYHHPIASVFTLTSPGQSTTSAGYYADNVSSTVGLEEWNTRYSALQLMPNPAADKVQLSTRNGQRISAARVLDVTGKELLYSAGPMRENFELDVSGLAPGIYLVEVVLPGGATETKKLQVTR